MVEEKTLLKHVPSDKVIYPWIIGKGVAILFGGLIFMIIILSTALSGITNVSGAFMGLFNVLLITLFAGAILMMVYYDFLRKTFEYRITSKGVHFKGGIFWKFDKFVSYRKVTNISSEQGIVEQAVKLSHINIHTAGQLTGAQGRALPEITIEGLPAETNRKILELLRNKISN